MFTAAAEMLWVLECTSRQLRFSSCCSPPSLGASRTSSSFLFDRWRSRILWWLKFCQLCSRGNIVGLARAWQRVAAYLLKRVRDIKSYRRHLPLLADPVDPGQGLFLDSGVPKQFSVIPSEPRVVMDLGLGQSREDISSGWKQRTT